MASTTTSIFRLPSGTRAATFDRLVEHAEGIEGVWLDEVCAGDWVIVRTRNSVYSMTPVGEGRFHVTGGWFRSRTQEEQNVRICGCTWGGSAIHTRLLAAAGMFLEFDNGVRTTRIQDVRVIKGRDDDRTH
ncbi:MAG TPA: hypothetical protein VFV78_05575 [Vicinamibacterales bacterium]|nr:hypothetical protein [Vicinamibacterales bacterium]